ncbi:hypothetical protein ARMSODRAFT_968773 [Armillaria solidipes]|uniref:Uncharacterized protein n=1 Tax=Armillaria solidipes TaxID=1076256 RepID=A0A2H3CTR8_9AGAR|nr:hypothetical protein ARMSODRAFT_968773 [Armillaria solidipes]
MAGSNGWCCLSLALSDIITFSLKATSLCIKQADVVLFKNTTRQCVKQATISQHSDSINAMQQASDLEVLPAHPSLLQLLAPAPQILDLVGIGMTCPTMRNWAHLENVCVAFDLEILTFELTSRSVLDPPVHVNSGTWTWSAKLSPILSSMKSTSFQIWCSAISITGRHILLIHLCHRLDITTLSLGSKKPHSNKSAISQPSPGGDYARMRSTVGTAHMHILPVAPSSALGSQILDLCDSLEHRILDLTSGNGFTDIAPPPPINACLCRKEF